MPSHATNEIATRNVTYAHLGNSTTINCINKSKKKSCEAMMDKNKFNGLRLTKMASNQHLAIFVINICQLYSHGISK